MPAVAAGLLRDGSERRHQLPLGQAEATCKQAPSLLLAAGSRHLSSRLQAPSSPELRAAFCRPDAYLLPCPPTPETPGLASRVRGVQPYTTNEIREKRDALCWSPRCIRAAFGSLTFP